MSNKKWSKLLILLLVFSVVICATLQFVMDPFLRYGKESFYLTYYSYNEMYANPGIAIHYDYDSVMVGTSMVENTDVNLCNELFGVNMVKLPYSGGTTYNMKTILDVCFNSTNEINNIYWELDEFQLMGSATEPRHPLPEYMYTSSHINDLKYLLNLDILYHYTLRDIIRTIQGENQKLAREGVLWDAAFCKESAIKSVKRKSFTNDIKDFANTYKETVDSNLANIEGLIEAHPNTHFAFFMPPFSVLYWYNTLQNGEFDANMDAIIYSINKLNQYENVTVYFYQDEIKTITNLDNYKDYSHYGPWINDDVSKWMSEGKGIIDNKKCETRINVFRKFIKGYDFDAVFNDN